MGSYQTQLKIINQSKVPIANTYVTDTDNHDWDGESRPDHNFQGRSIAVNTYEQQREELNSNARTAWFKMTIAFNNGDLIAFRNDQYAARKSLNQEHPLDGPSASRYKMHQNSGGDLNTLTIKSV